MRDTTVAARYARALFIATERRQETERALGDLKGVLEVVRPGTRVASFLATPEVRLPDKRRALQDALRGRALPIVAVFFDLLLRKKRLPEFPVVVTEFESLVEEMQGIQRAQVVSAVPLTAPELERLHRELERTTRHHIRLTTRVELELVGGAYVRIGDRVLDRSVRTLLESIARQLYEVSV